MCNYVAMRGSEHPLTPQWNLSLTETETNFVWFYTIHKTQKINQPSVTAGGVLSIGQNALSIITGGQKGGQNAKEVDNGTLGLHTHTHAM